MSVTNVMSVIYVDTEESPRLQSTGPHAGRTFRTDMLSLIRSHHTHPMAEYRRLVAGDFCFSGNGPKGPCLVGIERKRTRDLLNSLRSQRFSGEQLPKLVEHYEYVFLVLEGCHRTNWNTGLLEIKQGKDWTPLSAGTESHFLGLELDSFLNSLSLSPIRIRQTSDERGTVEFILSLHHSFSKPWSEHNKKLSGIHTPPEYAMVGRASTVRRVAYTLSGVGWERSGAVEQRFRSVAEMCEAEVEDWKKLEGFGPVLSKRVYGELRGEIEPKSKGGL